MAPPSHQFLRATNKIVPHCTFSAHIIRVKMHNMLYFIWHICALLALCLAAMSPITNTNCFHFRSSITELVMLGADSDCNACVAGALLGCRDGYRLLPAHWVDGLRSKQVDWLNVKVNLLLDMMAIP